MFLQQYESTKQEWLTWKIITLFDKLSDACTKFYKSYEHLAVHKITLLFKRRVIFKQYISK